MAAPTGNANAATHGAYSGRTVGTVAARHRRRLLRRLALSPRQLDAIGRAHLDQYVRLTAKLELLDAYLSEHGLVTADGEPAPVLRLYVTLSNSARSALTRLEAHLRSRAESDPHEPLRLFLEGLPGGDDEGDERAAA